MADYVPTPINNGVADNDGTGDPWRTGWIKVNVNFNGIAADLATRAKQVDLDAETAARETAISDLAAELALKADIGGADDLSATYARFDAAQTISNTERRQLGANTGALITLPFLLVDGLTDPASGTFNLPILPADFNVFDMFLTLSQRTMGTGGTFQVAYSLDNGGVTAGGQIATNIPASGKLGSTIIIAGRVLLNGVANTLTVVVTDTETGAPVHKGLTLWLRGTWAA